MGHRYAEIAFTDSVKQLQVEQGSRNSYARMEQGPDSRHVLTAKETAFIGERDSFYVGTVSETGWPYVQHRGGAKGFLRVLDPHTLGFVDYSGNRQYITAGNLIKQDRVSLFLMDYANRRRLKIYGHMQQVPLTDPRMRQLVDADSGITVERGFVIVVEAFDWNCPKFITPRFDQDTVRQLIAPLMEENERLRAALAATGADLAALGLSENDSPNFKTKRA